MNEPVMRVDQLRKSFGDARHDPIVRHIRHQHLSNLPNHVRSPKGRS
jgi:hypothetical protein